MMDTRYISSYIIFINLVLYTHITILGAHLNVLHIARVPSKLSKPYKWETGVGTAHWGENKAS